MASKTVSEFAQELKVAAKTLLAQLRAAGVQRFNGMKRTPRVVIPPPYRNAEKALCEGRKIP